MDLKRIALAVMIVAALFVGGGFVANSIATPTAGADPAPADAAPAADNDDVQSGFQGEQEDDRGDGDEVNDGDEVGEVDDEIEEAALIESAGISEDLAIAAASAEIEGIVIETELDSEGGVVVWSIEFDSGLEAKVDATTGDFLRAEADDD